MSKNRNQNQNVAAIAATVASAIEKAVERPAPDTNTSTAPIVEVQKVAEAPKIPGLPANFNKDAFLAQHNGNKSAAIRALRAMGMEVGPIAKAMEVKYQHVRNVLLQPLGAKIAPVTSAPSAPTTQTEDTETEQNTAAA
jgi:hypothetical protein